MARRRRPSFISRLERGDAAGVMRLRRQRGTDKPKLPRGARPEEGASLRVAEYYASIRDRQYKVDESARQQELAAKREVFARKRLSSLAWQFEREAGLKHLAPGLRKVADGAGGDSVAALQQAEKIRNDYRRAQNDARSIKGRLLSGLGKGLELVGKPHEEVQQTVYASERARLRGAGVPTQARAAVGSVPGLGFVAGSGRTRKDVEDVNTRAERQALREKGELASIGELASGRAGKVLKGDARKRYLANKRAFVSPFTSGGARGLIPDKASGAIDLGANIGLTL